MDKETEQPVVPVGSPSREEHGIDGDGSPTRVNNFDFDVADIATTSDAGRARARGRVPKSSRGRPTRTGSLPVTRSRAKVQGSNASPADVVKAASFVDGSPPGGRPLRDGHVNQGSTRSGPAEGAREGVSTTPAADHPKWESVPPHADHGPTLDPFDATLPQDSLTASTAEGTVRGGARPAPPCTRESKGTSTIISSLTGDQQPKDSPARGRPSAVGRTSALTGADPGTRIEPCSRDTRGAPTLALAARTDPGIDHNPPAFRRPVTPERGGSPLPDVRRAPRVGHPVRLLGQESPNRGRPSTSAYARMAFRESGADIRTSNVSARALAAGPSHNAPRSPAIRTVALGHNANITYDQEPRFESPPPCTRTAVRAEGSGTGHPSGDLQPPTRGGPHPGRTGTLDPPAPRGNGDEELEFLRWVEYNTQVMARFPGSPTIRYMGDIAGYRPGSLDELPTLETRPQGPLAWVISVHTAQQLMLDELEAYKAELQEICVTSHPREAALYTACLEARMCRLVAPIDYPNFRLIWDSLLEVVSAWKEEAVEPASVTSSPRRGTPTRPAPRAPERRQTEALARLPESLPGSCASSPRSVRRAMSCTLSPPRRSKRRKNGGEVARSLPPCEKPRPRAEPAALVKKHSSRYFKAPYVGAAGNYASQSQRRLGPIASASSDSSDSEAEDRPRGGAHRRNAAQHRSRIGTVSFRDRIKAFPKFAQPRPDLSWTDFLHGFTRVLRQHAVPASEWALWLADRLTGKAQSLLVNLEDHELDSWDTLVAALNAQFNVTQVAALARQTLMTRTQGKKETVADYINDLQLLARRAYADDMAKRQEVVMDRLRDGLATPSLRQCFDACEEEEGEIPFMVLQSRLIHRESRDEPERYRAQLLSAPSGSGASGQQNATVANSKEKQRKRRPSSEAGTSEDIRRIKETLSSLQLTVSSGGFTRAPVPARDTKYFNQKDVCWQCGSPDHVRRHCPDLSEPERRYLREVWSRRKEPHQNRRDPPSGRHDTTRLPPPGTSSKGSGN